AVVRADAVPMLPANCSSEPSLRFSSGSKGEMLCHAAGLNGCADFASISDMESESGIAANAEVKSGINRRIIRLAECSGRLTDSATRSQSRHGGGHQHRAPRKSRPRQCWWRDRQCVLAPAQLTGRPKLAAPCLIFRA